MSSEENSESESEVENQGLDEERLKIKFSNDRAEIREQLSSMSFEEIQKLKAEIGLKFYNERVNGNKIKKPKANFKRANKNRPREMSSKVRVKVKTAKNLIQKQEIRDPRFDLKCGQYDERTFKSNYKFINDLRKKEKKELQKEYELTSDPARKKQIKFLMQRIDNQLREEEKRQKLEEQKLSERNEIMEKVNRGFKQIYKKKSVKKVDNLIHKYEELKKSNKLQKHIEKKNKKLSIKEKMERGLLQ